nr:hypothetical protein [Tanacetum cinerariifolium]
GAVPGTGLCAVDRRGRSGPRPGAAQARPLGPPGRRGPARQQPGSADPTYLRPGRPDRPGLFQPFAAPGVRHLGHRQRLGCQVADEL